MGMGVLTTALAAFLLLSTPSTQTYREPKNLRINEHVSYETERTSEGGLHVRFQFKDHTETSLVFEHTYDYQRTLEMSARFGLPSDFMRSYAIEEKPNRLKIIENGMLQLKGGKISVDLSAVTTFYSEEFAKPMAEFIVESLRQRGMDTRMDRIAMAMAFVQDIPYGVPEFDDGIDRWELSPAPLILLSGFGDCDSKATLFVGILRYLINPKDILFIEPEGRDHLLTAIRGDRAPGRTFIDDEGSIFVFADVAGPGRLAFGEKGANAEKGGSVIVHKYEERLPAFHADADYSTYHRGVFTDVFGNVAFKGSKSQETAQGDVRSARGEDAETIESETVIALSKVGEEGRRMVLEMGKGRPAEVSVSGNTVTVGPFRIRHGGGSVEVFSSETNSTVLLKCGETLTLPALGDHSRLQLFCK